MMLMGSRRRKVVVGPVLLAVLDLLFGVLVEILSEVHEHEDGDRGAKALLHGFENGACFHDVCVLMVNVLITI